MKCKDCNSENVEINKIIGRGTKEEKSFHFQLHCFKCRSTYFLKKTKELFELCKDKDWVMSKSVVKNERKKLQISLF